MVLIPRCDNQHSFTCQTRPSVRSTGRVVELCVRFAGTAVVLLLSANCGSNHEEAVSVTVAVTSSAPAFQSIAANTAPDANCTLKSGLDPSVHSQMVADSRGAIRFLLGGLARLADGQFALECADASGEQLPSRSIDESTLVVPGTSESPATQSLQAAAGTLRPALKGDPLAPSQRDLFAAGYPFRPDPNSSPGEYARWLSIVSRSFTKDDGIGPAGPKRVNSIGASRVLKNQRRET
jgi:hypothetical protein